MTKIITANFLIWKGMDLQSESRTKRPKIKLKGKYECPACLDKHKIYCPDTDSYRKCRRCDGSRIINYDWFD